MSDREPSWRDDPSPSNYGSEDCSLTSITAANQMTLFQDVVTSQNVDIAATYGAVAKTHSTPPVLKKQNSIHPTDVTHHSLHSSSSTVSIASGTAGFRSDHLKSSPRLSRAHSTAMTKHEDDTDDDDLLSLISTATLSSSTSTLLHSQHSRVLQSQYRSSMSSISNSDRSDGSGSSRGTRTHTLASGSKTSMSSRRSTVLSNGAAPSRSGSVVSTPRSRYSSRKSSLHTLEADKLRLDSDEYSIEDVASDVSSDSMDGLIKCNLGGNGEDPLSESIDITELERDALNS